MNSDKQDRDQAKLYVVLKAALDSGLKIAQAIHVFRSFVGEYPHIEQPWHDQSNNIVVLQHEDPDGLGEHLEGMGYAVSRFWEPDRDGELTGLCVEPAAWRQLSSLPLAS